MQKEPNRHILWANLEKLMQAHYGKVNLTRLASEARIAPSTASRLKNQDTSVGLDILDTLAVVFGLEGWQLLVPDLNPGLLPEVSGASDWPFPMVDQGRVSALPASRRLLIQGYLIRCIEEQEKSIMSTEFAAINSGAATGTAEDTFGRTVTFEVPGYLPGKGGTVISALCDADGRVHVELTGTKAQLRRQHFQLLMTDTVCLIDGQRTRMQYTSLGDRGDGRLELVFIPEMLG